MSDEYVAIAAGMIILGFAGLIMSLTIQSILYKNKILEGRIKVVEESVNRIIFMDDEDE